MKKPKITEKLFWSHVNKNGPVRRFLLGQCWEWTGRQFNGHGTFHEGHRNFWAHRVSWEFSHGKIPEGLNVNHRCGNGLCVRPTHLHLGTQAQNMREAAEEKTLATGTRNGNSKLTQNDVLAIRLFALRKFPRKYIAKRFHVGVSTVNEIVCGKTWKHVKI